MSVVLTGKIFIEIRFLAYLNSKIHNYGYVKYIL